MKRISSKMLCQMAGPVFKQVCGQARNVGYDRMYTLVDDRVGDLVQIMVRKNMPHMIENREDGNA